MKKEIEILELKHEIYKTVRDAIVFNDVKNLDEELTKIEAKLEVMRKIRLEDLAGRIRYE